MIILGVTGSIGMGKTTVSAMLEKLGIPVHDADEEVHRLLSEKGEAIMVVKASFPYFAYPQIYGRKNRHGVRPILRGKLGKIIFSDDKKREKLEAVLHPFIREAQNGFIRKYKAQRKNIIALDIPLLFETGAEALVDFTINVSAPFCVQHARVMDRPGMNAEKFQAILERQMPDREKSARADYVLHSGLGHGHAMRELKSIISRIKGEEELHD